MNRDEYIKHLKYRLRRLPREEFDKAISYFTEYFQEAGPENEAQAIEDLGTPELAADQIIREFAVNNAKEPVKDVKHGISAVWIGILAVFAAPVGLPLALMLGVMGLMLILIIFTFILCVFVLIIAVAAYAVSCIIAGVWMLFTSFADGAATLGFGLIGLGIGILLATGSICLWKYVLRQITRLFGKIVKGGNQHGRYEK